jgi:succinate dehydrogenase/fumarate reductase cytochrome b subunit
MTNTYQMPTAMAETRTLITARLASILPPVLALLFPLSVWCFYTSTAMVREAGGWTMALPLCAAAISLTLAAAPTIVSYLMLLRPLEQADRFAGTRWITYLAFATPAFYTAERVFFTLFQSPADDRYLWTVIWAALVVVAAIGRRQRVMRQPPWTGRLRTIHGIAAALIVAAFLIAHFGNHLVALIGTQTHSIVQDVLRMWYRNYVIEPVIVALFLFQVGSGLVLAFIYRFAHGDRFRTLHVATGIGIMAFLLAHMTVLLLVARWQLDLDTNWDFATSARTGGILANANNARQVPYYLFAVMAVVAHLACGLRLVLLGHGWRTVTVNRLAIGIMCLGAVIAAAIMAAMLGVRFA